MAVLQVRPNGERAMATNPATADDEGQDHPGQARSQTVVDFLEGERGPQPVVAVAAGLHHLGKYSGGVWPLATVEEWREAIREAAAEGLVLVADGRVGVPLATIAEEEKGDAVSQGSLF